MIVAALLMSVLISTPNCPELPSYEEGPFQYHFVSAPLADSVILVATLHSGGYYVAGPVLIRRDPPLEDCYGFYYQTNPTPPGEGDNCEDKNRRIPQ